MTTVTISAAERRILRDEVATDLCGISDLYKLWDNGKPGRDLLSTRGRIANGLWLADDLGWDIDDPRSTFHVTLPTAKFAAWLRELDAFCQDQLEGTSEELREPERMAARYGVPTATLVRDLRRDADRALDLRRVCRAVLARMGA